MQEWEQEIRKLAGPAEAQAYAQMMAGSEPWITLRRGYEEALAMFDDPGREVYVAAAGEEIVGFVILQMRGALWATSSRWLLPRPGAAGAPAAS